MTKKSIDAKTKQIKGGIKYIAGRLMGNPNQQLEGADQYMKGTLLLKARSLLF